jgi:ABC-type uncharacterized transport system permease subunit
MSGEQIVSVAAQTVTYAAPLLFAGLGELFSERAGVINIGLEGQMLCGAFAAALVSALTHSPALGLLAAVGGGMAAGALFALFGVGLRRDQVIVGTTLNFLALGLTGMFYRAWTTGQTNAPVTVPLPRLIGSGASSLNLLTILAVALVPVAGWLLFRTRLGVAIRAAGDAPEAAAAAGTAVGRLRVLICLANGALCGLGGAALSIGINSTFTENMTGGLGFIALAVVVFGRWRPGGVLGAALLFAAADVLQSRLQAANALALPYPVFLALPYFLTLAALALRGARSRPPSALGVPFVQG